MGAAFLNQLGPVQLHESSHEDGGDAYGPGPPMFVAAAVADEERVFCTHAESVKGRVTLGLDLERPYSGHEVDVEVSVTFERLGRNLVGPAEFEVERASLHRDY